MKFALSLLALAASASAFAPNTPSFRNTALRMSEEVAEEVAEAEEAPVEEAPPAPVVKSKVPCVGASPFLGGKTIFLGESTWDKLTMEWGSEETGKFIRAAELKHGRSAMIATVGYAFHKIGWTFDQISVHEYLSVTKDIKFADLAAMNPVDAMKSLPAESWGQMFAFCSLIEIYELTHTNGKLSYDETVAPGLQPGGLTGDLGWNPLQITVDDRRRTVELQNGRAAMFAISAWIAAETIPGSMPIPLLWSN
mmetsp:Transcript_745/g.1663  ORF Transcript_745/g.1663 Transcript_745/m.1663 type:complete len:252 (-) Transcript_745:138-893(-)|eukprot:CAMPEP_0201123596 /NCGR_PEP_ID=MMETSP0850-20130426/7984_1 /ASSEMBLY_ACC=CAM_ASM_000622 /TAXON_ID=183588 /ORGANISM="Pseudo-nitzschia fraudulenta, Strain WWA7" /LENGTH=251 /DNA_ID=CAMNT_0047390589 /DNA_START=70 /DNA_END=825 /DNA_ORIENTATION=-